MTGREATEAVTTALVEHLEADGYRCWTEVPLERVGRHMRADVLALKPGFFWEHADVRIYEVKCSRQDFLGDVRSGKSEGYRDYAHRVFYAGPPEVVEPEVVPRMFGVVHLASGCLTTVRPAGFAPCRENAALLLYLMGRDALAAFSATSRNFARGGCGRVYDPPRESSGVIL